MTIAPEVELMEEHPRRVGAGWAMLRDADAIPARVREALRAIRVEADAAQAAGVVYWEHNDATAIKHAKLADVASGRAAALAGDFDAPANPASSALHRRRLEALRKADAHAERANDLRAELANVVVADLPKLQAETLARAAQVTKGLRKQAVAVLEIVGELDAAYAMLDWLETIPGAGNAGPSSQPPEFVDDGPLHALLVDLLELLPG